MSQNSYKIFSKHNLYIICFMVLNLIEFLRAVGNGDVWKTAANCTGFVMMVLIFSRFSLRQFLRPLYYIYTLLCCIAMVLVYFHWTKHIGEYSLGQIETAVLNIWWLGLAVHHLLMQFKAGKIKIVFGIKSVIWIVMTLWTVIGVSGRWWPIWFLCMFGVFYLIPYGGEDKCALVDGMVDGTILSFFIIQCYAYLFRPYDEIRYRGAFSNSNTMALYYLIVYCMFLLKLYLLNLRNAKKIKIYFCFLCASGLLGFQLLTLCRTAWVITLIVTCSYGWLVIHKFQGKKVRTAVTRGFALLLCSALTFPIIFATVRYLPTIHPHPVWYDGEYNTRKVHSWDPYNSEKYVNWDEFIEALFGRVIDIIDILKYIDKKISMHSPLVLKAYAMENIGVVEVPDEIWRTNSFMMRLLIFRAYLKDSTWFGNVGGEGLYQFPGSPEYIWHSQNLWIQMTYSFGYPVGVLLIVLSILIWVSSFRKAMHMETNMYAILSFLVCIVYFGFGLMEIVWNPGQLVLTLIFIVQHPGLNEGKKGDKCFEIYSRHYKNNREEKVYEENSI